MHKNTANRYYKKMNELNFYKMVIYLFAHARSVGELEDAHDFILWNDDEFNLDSKEFQDLSEIYKRLGYSINVINKEEN